MYLLTVTCFTWLLQDLRGCFWCLQCVSKKFTLFKSHPIYINISRYFQEMFIHVRSYGSLVSNDTTKKRYCMLEWAWATFVKLTKIQAWQELVFVLAAIRKIESREKASKLSFWWSDDNLWKNIHCCVYVLTYAINIICFIELFITLLSVLVTFWCVL